MPLTISLTITDEGNLQIQGIPDNPIMALGILEAGKAAMLEHYRAAREQRVQGVTMIPPGFGGLKS